MQCHSLPRSPIPAPPFLLYFLSYFIYEYSLLLVQHCFEQGFHCIRILLAKPNPPFFFYEHVLKIFGAVLIQSVLY
ncbi:hypothetical protein T492DRAFT_914186 [Pavlovales sp. CCMP2436]|nr:hypothetical protein T492DRAFT_914186 [Pavlovales sp. CCMP2436]